MPKKAAPKANDSILTSAAAAFGTALGTLVLKAGLGHREEKPEIVAEKIVPKKRHGLQTKHVLQPKTRTKSTAKPAGKAPKAKLESARPKPRSR